MSSNELLRLPEVSAYVKLSKASIYALMSKKQFPKPKKLAERAVAWRKTDVDAWIDALPDADVSKSNEF